MFKRSLPFLALVLLAIEPGLAAGASRLDPSFGDKGFVKAPGTAEWIGDIPAPSNRTAIYPGGRLVVGGHSELGFAVYRYQGNGSLDQDFGKGGVAIVRLPGEEGGFVRKRLGCFGAGRWEDPGWWPLHPLPGR